MHRASCGLADPESFTIQEWIPGTHQLSVQEGKELIDQIASKGEPFAAEVLQPQHMALGDVLVRDVRGLHRGVRAETFSMVWHGLTSLADARAVCCADTEP